MEDLTAISGLIISQQKEWAEILTGFETKNRYLVSDNNGRGLYQAAEEKGSLLARWFLKALRPFTITVVRDGGQVVLRIVRPFRFYFHRAEVLDGQGQSLGVIERKFSVLRRIYSVQTRSGRELFEMFGPILHPWTFHIKKGNRELGKITKKWSGLLKEGFTDADTFGVMFPAEWDVKLKGLFLGAVFLIDFVHFENKGNN
jgi:uncharacterized protein YxjI